MKDADICFLPAVEQRKLLANGDVGVAELVAAQKGYQLILVIPDKMSPDKIRHIRAMGVDVRLTRSDVQKGHPEYYQDLAKSLSDEIEGAFFINQFGNPSNPKAHEETTGPEIWEQMGGKILTTSLMSSFAHVFRLSASLEFHSR